MIVLLKLLALVPVAHALLWAILVIGLWLVGDLLVSRRKLLAQSLGIAARVVEGSASRPVRRVRWKVAVLSGLAASELVLCLLGVTLM